MNFQRGLDVVSTVDARGGDDVEDIRHCEAAWACGHAESEKRAALRRAGRVMDETIWVGRVLEDMAKGDKCAIYN